jgi:hypothetical protein
MLTLNKKQIQIVLKDLKKKKMIIFGDEEFLRSLLIDKAGKTKSHRNSGSRQWTQPDTLASSSIPNRASPSSSRALGFTQDSTSLSPTAFTPGSATVFQSLNQNCSKKSIKISPKFWILFFFTEFSFRRGGERARGPVGPAGAGVCGAGRAVLRVSAARIGLPVRRCRGRQQKGLCLLLTIKNLLRFIAVFGW